MKYQIKVGNKTINGLRACVTYLLHKVSKSHTWRENCPVVVRKGADDKTAFVQFDSGHWYVFNFEAEMVNRIPDEVIEVLVDENETQKRVAILMKNLHLVALMVKHMHSCDWVDGLPIKPFFKDGFSCIQYESGRWWHYDIDNLNWF